MFENTDRRLWIIVGLLVLSGLLYISTNFKEIAETFQGGTKEIITSTQKLTRNILSGGDPSLPTELLASMQHITNILNH